MAAFLGALALILATLAFGVAQDPQPKTPEPKTAAQNDAVEELKKIFKNEYAKAEKDVAARQALIAELMKVARETKGEPVLRFVAFREARDMAVQSGDITSALAAIQELTRFYVVDEAAMKADALALAAKVQSTKDGHQTIATEALAAVVQAVDEDNYDAAVRLLTVAEKAAQQLSNAPLLDRIARQRDEVLTQQKEYGLVKSAFAKRKTEPNDPDANLAVGRYWCLFKNQWDRGLPLLVKGKEALKELAEKDLAKSIQTKEQLEIGDSWWDLSEKEKGLVRANLQQRAYFWYRQAAPTLVGDDKVRVAKRIQKVEATLPQLEPDRVGLIRIFLGHTRQVNSAAFSPDGRRIVSGSDDETVRLWELQTGKELKRLTGHGNEVWSVAYAPDGRRVLSGSDDRTVRLWDIESGKEEHVFKGHTRGVNFVTFSPDGLRILSCSDDTTAHVWDARNPFKDLTQFTGHTRAVWSGAFSADGKYVLTGGFDKVVRLWEADTGKEVRTFEGHNAFVQSVAFSPDGKQALSGGDDKTLRLWDVDSGKELRRFEGHTGIVFSVAFSPDGKRALSGSADRSVRLWEVGSGKELKQFGEHRGDVGCVSFSPNGRFALSASHDHTIRLWGLPK
jgi:WD40 repeat protein